MSYSVIRLFNIALNMLRAPFVILRSFRLLTLCVIPYIIGFFSFGLFLYLALIYRDDIAGLLFSFETSWIQGVLTWLTFLLASLLSTLLSLLLMLLLGGVFFEMFVEELLKKAGVLEDLNESAIAFSLRFIRGLWDDVRRLLFVLLILLLVFLCSFFPLLLFVPPLVAGMLLGYEIIEIPLLLLRKRLNQRIKIVRQHFIEVTALGLLFSVLVLIPLGGILFLPFAYYSAVQLVLDWKIEASK